MAVVGGVALAVCAAANVVSSDAFRLASSSLALTIHGSPAPIRQQQRTWLKAAGDGGDDDYADYDPNRWIGTEDESSLGDNTWQEAVSERANGSLWSSFASSDESEEIVETEVQNVADEDGGEEAWLDVLAGISADEVSFMAKEAERADKARQMNELGYSAESISSTLGIATDEGMEIDQDNEVFQAFKEETAKTGFGLQLDEEVDMELVESHTTVEWDEDTDEPVRLQMVYVDEVSCIGCTNCACIAQSTFFMEGEHGRARVFQQWGDDDETVQVAIDTCPVNCIHYVPYDELKSLEIERRGQNINNKARLVSQAENASGIGPQATYGGAGAFTGQQKISGNMGSRCNNCPGRGCANCPMFGVGKNPEFQKREAARKEKIAQREMQKQMESRNKRAEL